MRGIILLSALLPLQASTLFTDMPSSGAIYNPNAHNYPMGTAPTDAWAMAFTVTGSGAQSVSQIDVGLLGNGAADYSVAIFTDVSGAPGAQVADAFWGNQASASGFGNCCNLETISSISGVTLTGGDQYFMAVSNIPSGQILWATTVESVTGDVQSSGSGGATWADQGVTTLGAFDVIGQPAAAPEPVSFASGSLGLAALWLWRRRGMCKRQINPIRRSRSSTDGSC